MKENLTVQEFLDAKSKMESSIRAATATAMFEFEEHTGRSPNYINTQLLPAQNVNERFPRYIVGGVTCDVPLKS